MKIADEEILDSGGERKRDETLYPVALDPVIPFAENNNHAGVFDRVPRFMIRTRIILVTLKWNIDPLTEPKSYRDFKGVERYLIRGACLDKNHRRHGHQL